MSLLLTKDRKQLYWILKEEKKKTQILLLCPVFLPCRFLFRQKTECTVLDKPATWTFTTWLPRDLLMITCGLYQTVGSMISLHISKLYCKPLSSLYSSTFHWAKTGTARCLVNVGHVIFMLWHTLNQILFALSSLIYVLNQADDPGKNERLGASGSVWV